MTWFGANYIVGLIPCDGNSPILAMENVIVIQADTYEEALSMAEKEGREEAALHSRYLFGDRAVDGVFAGVRRLFEITNMAKGLNSEDPPTSEAEISSSSYEVSDKETLLRLGNGETVEVLYLDSAGSWLTRNR